MLNLVTSLELQSYQQVQSDLARGYPVSLAVPSPVTTQCPQWLQMTPDSWLASLQFGSPNENLLATELSRRTSRIQMALAAWQLEHDSLPRRLEDLKDEYLKQIPLDPHTGEPFVYFPEGLSEPLKHYHEPTGEATVILEAGRPFFWSSGANVSIGQPHSRGPIPLASSPMQKYSIRFGAEWQRAASPELIWAAGRVFSIPQPKAGE
jgi:hypothetical protein